MNILVSIVIAVSGLGLAAWSIYRILHRKWNSNIVSASYEGEIMTVKTRGGETIKYKGSYAVWHEIPYMNTVNISSSLTLFELWEYTKEYGNPYPNAHKSKT